MLLKSTLTPDVLATAVPEVIPSTAPELIVTLAEPSKVIAMIYPSYMMFTDPAVKVSVPLVVKNRTLSNVPPKETRPAVVVESLLNELFVVPDAIQMFEPSVTKTIEPLKT
jgi:hypothetical protein